MIRFATSLVAVSAIASPALAQSQDPLAPLPATTAPAHSQPAAPVPTIPTAQQPVQSRGVTAPKDWRGVFDAIQNGDWASAQAGIYSLPSGVLTPVALAELYTAKGSPVVSLQQIQALLAQAPDLPEAGQLARMAIARGAVTAPPITPVRAIVPIASAPRRYRAAPVAGEPLADQLRSQLDPLIKTNDAANAEALLNQQGPYLSAEARAEAAQRVAWAYYSLGQDQDARRVADTWRSGATGEWASAAAWVSGLASWRLNDCNSASADFRTVASTTSQTELRAGALYWAARAEQACRRPQAVTPLLEAAAQSPESFYGLLARETLGTETRLSNAPVVSTASVETQPNVQRAVQLAAIGEPALAGDMLRYQARIGAPADQEALIAVAKRLNLAGAQYWLATNGQPGARVYPSEKYPHPAWSPSGGWRVDPALAYAHIIQESNFQPNAVSPADAVGLMQVTPITVRQHAASLNFDARAVDLSNPSVNLTFGQQNLEMLRSSPVTGGSLPKIMAAYNAGLAPVTRWAAIPCDGDPLLWMESIPYWETRYYVPAVMRNLWVYQGLENEQATSLKALAQHRWPTMTRSTQQ
jgi:soluble lytic murein transglycosylase-like protein